MPPKPQTPPPFDPIKYQNDMQQKAENNGRWNAAQANKVDLELCNNLMLLDTVALTATIIVLSGDAIVKSLGKTATVLLMITSISIVVSIFFGIANYITLNLFQRKWSRINGKLASIFSSQPLSPADMQQVAIAHQANVPSESQRVFWYGQIIFLGVALVLYLAIILAVLSKNF
jgi:hypothetical protein